jgi:hypothetical protein
MISLIRIWWRSRPYLKQLEELSRMKLSINVAIQALGTVAQLVNQTSDLLPPKPRFWATVALSAIQGLTAVLAHFANPDGTPARTAWVPPQG